VWTRIAEAGLGDANNWGVTLQAFNGYLYAGTLNEEASDPGAELWRCQDCGGSDWEQVPIAKGLGDPASYDFSALIAFDGAMYGLLSNDATGMQIWRTANGLDWEQDAPHGLGTSSNHPCGDNSVALFGDRLFLGTQNGAHGGQIWKRTVSASFAANPLSGPPPLQVHFTNTSAGDYKTALWHFGDGATSTETHPAHTFGPGAHSVSLTVDDGVDSDTVTYEDLISVSHDVHLPLGARQFNPGLYDDFEDIAYDGGYSPALWRQAGHSAFEMVQQGGRLVITNSAMLANNGGSLELLRPYRRTLDQCQEFEAALMLGSDLTGGWTSVQISTQTPDVGGHGWYTLCYLGASVDNKPSLTCEIRTWVGSEHSTEYYTGKWDLEFDTWYRARIEMDPATARVSFYMDDVLLDSHVPTDAAALLTVDDLLPYIGVWIGDEDVFATRSVDDVWITPVTRLASGTSSGTQNRHALGGQTAFIMPTPSGEDHNELAR